MAKATYVIRFIDFIENTRDEFEYSDLLSAIRVAKDTHIDGRPAISNEDFEEQLLSLLTSSFIYVGTKLDKYPDGSVMLQLFKRTDNTTHYADEAVYGPRIIPFVSGLIPRQPDYDLPYTPPVAEFFNNPERSTD